METRYLNGYDKTADAADLACAAQLLRAGKIVAIPTETVYGLAADAYNVAAVRAIFAAKGRPQDNPLIVHIAGMEMLDEVVSAVPEKALRLAERFWPGPLTMILPKAVRVPLETTAGLDTVAVRMPSNPIAAELIRLAGPLAAPSANRSGKPSPTAWQHCRDDLDGRADAVVMSAPCTVGVESTVVLMTGEVPVLLRPGGITLEQLRETLGEVAADDGILHPVEDGRKVRSPGMKYKHYAPSAEVILVRGDTEDYVQYVNVRAGKGVYAVCFAEDCAGLTVPALDYGRAEDEDAHANRVFDLLRELDHLEAKTAYIHAPSTQGVGLAVYNRLLRAAAFHVVELQGGK